MSVIRRFFFGLISRHPTNLNLHLTMSFLAIPYRNCTPNLTISIANFQPFVSVLHILVSICFSWLTIFYVQISEQYTKPYNHVKLFSWPLPFLRQYIPKKRRLKTSLKIMPSDDTFWFCFCSPGVDLQLIGLQIWCILRQISFIPL